MKMITICATTLLLVGCNSLGRVGSPMWHMTASNSEKANAFINVCASYGFKRNTPEMAQCVAEESRASRQGARDRMKSLQSMQQRNRMVNCTSTKIGTTINTNCY